MTRSNTTYQSNLWYLLFLNISVHISAVFQGVIRRAELHFDIKSCHKVVNPPETRPFLSPKFAITVPTNGFIVQSAYAKHVEWFLSSFCRVC